MKLNHLIIFWTCRQRARLGLMCGSIGTCIVAVHARLWFGRHSARPGCGSDFGPIGSVHDSVVMCGSVGTRARALLLWTARLRFGRAHGLVGTRLHGSVGMCLCARSGFTRSTSTARHGQGSHGSIAVQEHGSVGTWLSKRNFCIKRGASKNLNLASPR